MIRAGRARSRIRLQGGVRNLAVQAMSGRIQRLLRLLAILLLLGVRVILHASFPLPARAGDISKKAVGTTGSGFLNIDVDPRGMRVDPFQVACRFALPAHLFLLVWVDRGGGARTSHSSQRGLQASKRGASVIRC